MNRPTNAFQAQMERLAAQAEARLPERARWIVRLPKWAWGCIALAGVLLIGRLLGGGAQPAATNGALPNTTLLAFDAVAKLGVVLGLFFIGVYAYKRWRSLLPSQAERRITVVETTRLSQRQALHLVRVGEQLLLIGATDQGLSLLTELDEPAARTQTEAPADFLSEFALRQSLPEQLFDFSAALEHETR